MLILTTDFALKVLTRCKYQRSLISKKKYSHKNSLPVLVKEPIKPVFQDLVNKVLLKKCSHGCTQNLKVSYLNCFLKIVFMGNKMLHFGVYEALISFNDGYIMR